MSMYNDDSLIEVYVFETTQLIDELEQLMIECEMSGSFTKDSIDQIFRAMHTIKGSSAMMNFNSMSVLAHKIEDIFYAIREDESYTFDFFNLVELILESIDYYKIELDKIRASEDPDGDNQELIDSVKVFLEKTATENKEIKHTQKSEEAGSLDLVYFKFTLWFKSNAKMEGVRSLTVFNDVKEQLHEYKHTPEELNGVRATTKLIRNNGFFVTASTTSDLSEIKKSLETVDMLDNLDFAEITKEDFEVLSSMGEVSESDQAKEEQTELKLDFTKELVDEPKLEVVEDKVEEKKVVKPMPKKVTKQPVRKDTPKSDTKSTMISVNVDKLDMLMDMVGELVISEAMVTQNPEVTRLEIESFYKASRQLHKITRDLQDMVMSIRMVPLSTTFIKMHRIIRDMKKKLNKDVTLEVVGEETEVDKNVIDMIADPLMHLIRNAIDHGIESEDDRVKKGKNPIGTITLEAKNSGSDVLIIIRDDGKGIDRVPLYEKAKKNGLVTKDYEEMNPKDILKLILHPGLSTKQKVTEFSGRGVGMDVVAKNIESIGGSLDIESEVNLGTTIILKIPLTLAIIDGMNTRVGQSRFTIPIASVRESFRPKEKDIIRDPEGREMIIVRNQSYPIIRLHDFYGVEPDTTDMSDGILIMVEDNDKRCCIFVDELINQQQVVIKSLPEFVKKFKSIRGLGGCTLLGDGSISLILDVAKLEQANSTLEY